MIRPLYTYLDAPVLKCNTSPEFAGLRFLYTTKQRAQDWDQLLSIFRKEIKSNQEILMVGYLNFGPLYLLNLRDWNHGVCTGGKDFMKRFYTNSKKKELPGIAFADEYSSEFESFRNVLIQKYISIYTLKRKNYCYSIWKLK